MWRIIRSLIVLPVSLAAAALLWPMRALDWVGRVMTIQQSNDLVEWIGNHPRIAVDFGPWILWAGCALVLGHIWIWPLVKDRLASLQIAFDTLNPGNRFWDTRRRNYIDNDGDDCSESVVHYRIMLRKRFGRPLHGVNAVVEWDDGESESLSFSRTGETSRDMESGAHEYIDLYKGLTKKDHADMLEILGGTIENTQRKFTLFIRARDMHQLEKRFVLDYSQDPPIRPL
jgi:hypothetical protein